jgi:ABC-type multidrug transport system ATPase subunit
MALPEVMIRISNLVVQYGSYRAVDGLDLNLYRGELFGLLGPNGAGKSTTVRVLIGQRRADGGEVSVGRLDVARQWQQVKSLFGYVPDRDNHFDEFTGDATCSFSPIFTHRRASASANV